MEKTLHLLIMYTMLVLMLLLLHKGRKDKRGLFLAVYALIEIITNGIDSISLWGGNGVYAKFPAILILAKPFTLLWVPLFWLYVKSCFSSDFKWKNKYLMHLLPFGLIMLFFLILREIQGVETFAKKTFSFETFQGYTLYAIDIIVRCQYVIYNVLMILQLRSIEKKIKLNDAPADLNTNIKWLRFIVYGYALACAGAVFVFILFHFNWSLAGQINHFSILYFFVFFFIIFYDTIAPKSLYSKKNVKPLPEINDEMKGIMERLDTLLAGKQIYLNPELSLTHVAEMMNEKERAISQAINTLKQRNFKDYINSYRIQHACELLKADKEKPIFEVMFDSGFNTKGPFNTAFKRVTGKTPTEFRGELE